MTVLVPEQPPCTMFGSVAPTGVQVGKPVVGDRWVWAGSLANWLRGHGGTLVTATTPGDRTHAAGSTTNYHYYIWPRYPAVMRLWVVGLLPNDEDEAWGDFDANGTKLGEWNIPADGADERVPMFFYFWETVSRSAVSANIYGTLDVDASSGASVIIHELSCYEVPRKLLDQDTNEVGNDQDTCQAGSTLLSDADGDAPTTYESIGGVRYSVDAAKNQCRRNGIFHWYDPDGRATSGTSYVDLFIVQPEALGRKVYSADGAGQTAGNTLEVQVLGYINGAESVADMFKVITVSGNSAAVTITSTLTWYGPIEIDVDCEDLTDAKGLRDSTWETLQFKLKGGENAGAIYGVSVGEKIP